LANLTPFVRRDGTLFRGGKAHPFSHVNYSTASDHPDVLPVHSLESLTKLQIQSAVAMATMQERNAAQQSVYPRSHVGFDSITSQIERKLLKRGFQFNVICVGE
jgi:hypothetical protein